MRWVTALLLIGCGAGAPAVPPASAALEPAVEQPSAAEVAVSDAIAERLADLPLPPVEWGTPLSALAPGDVAALCAYDHAHPRPPISAECAQGAHALIDANGGCAWDDVETHPLGEHCELTVGELVACRLALRDHPCARAGFGLPECTGVTACLDTQYDEVFQELVTAERITS